MAGTWNGLNYIGDATNEAVTGTEANEGLYGLAGDDQLSGGGGNDNIDGGVGNDVLDGGAGNDILTDVGSIPGGFVGVIGRDVLRGGADDDEIRFYSPDTGDVANGGTGVDTLRLNLGYFSGFQLPAGTVINLAMGPGGAASIMQFNGINTLSISNIERLIYNGVNASDFITGGAGDDHIFGGTGDDHLFGGDGNDSMGCGGGIIDMDGGQGYDIVSFTVAGLPTGLNIANRANQSLGLAGSVRNFEAYDEITLGNGANIVNLVQTTEVTITSGAGGDRISVLNARATIYAGYGDDDITTGSGNDEIEGSHGNNTVHMGAGDDFYRNSSNRSSPDIDRIFAEAGDDTVLTAAGADLVDGGAGDDELYTGWGDDRGYGGAGHDRIDGEAGHDTLYGGEGNDRLDGDRDVNVTTTPLEADALYGGTGNDTLIGGLGADQMFGGTGDDTLETRAFFDNVMYDLAVDTLYGGTGNDKLTVAGEGFSGTTGYEIILGATTLVRISGTTVVDAREMESLEFRGYGGGNHHIEGGALSDTVITGQGNELILTFGGNDIIENTFGSDTIYAGAGDDLVRQVQVGGGDLVYGGAGNDTINVGIAYLNQVLEAGVSTISGGAGFDTLFLYNSDRDVTFNGTAIFVAGVKVADVTGFEAVQLSGSNLAAVINGYAGNDTLAGGGGNDTINGNDGNDSIDGGANDDRIFGGAGNDTLLGGGGTDRQFGGDGDDAFTLTQDALADLIDGGTGQDRLALAFSLTAPVVMTGSLATGATLSMGGVLQANLTGIEILSGNASTGNDVLIGGTGNDTLSTYGGADVITTGGGDDTLTIVLDALADTISLGGGLDRITLQQSLAGNLSAVLSANMQVRIGGVLVATVQSADTLLVYSYGGNDTLTGGALDDQLYGGYGANLISGGLGNDTVSVGLDALADTLSGGAGTDRLTLYGVSDAISMDISMPDRVLVTSGGLTLVDATGFDALEVYGGFGANPDDLLRGIAGNDSLYGGSGDDTISGGLGDDSIRGGEGIDVMSGGGGADRFVFFSATDALPAGPTYDRISDFVSAADLLDLAALDAITTPGTVGNDAFVWIGAAAFGNVAGQLHYVQDVPGNRTLISGDLQGDGLADFVIQLTGLITVQAADLIL